MGKRRDQPVRLPACKSNNFGRKYLRSKVDCGGKCQRPAMVHAGVAIMIVWYSRACPLAAGVDGDLLRLPAGADRDLHQPLHGRRGHIIKRGNGDMEQQRQKRDHPGSTVSNRPERVAAEICPRFHETQSACSEVREKQQFVA